LNTKVENVIRFFKNILMYFLLGKAIYHIFSSFAFLGSLHDNLYSACSTYGDNRRFHLAFLNIFKEFQLPILAEKKESLVFSGRLSFFLLTPTTFLKTPIIFFKDSYLLFQWYLSFFTKTTVIFYKDNCHLSQRQPSYFLKHNKKNDFFFIKNRLQSGIAV